jgi:hypothetical protein
MDRAKVTSSWEKAGTGGLILLLVALAFLPGPAFAQYRWVDDKGNVHYSQSFSTIPEQYRSQGTLQVPPSPLSRDALRQSGRKPGGPPAPDDAAGAEITDADRQILHILQGRLQALLQEEQQCGQRDHSIKQLCVLRVQHERAAVQAILSSPHPLQALAEARQRTWQSLERDTLLLLGGLQRVALRLREKGGVTYDGFVAQMEAFRRDFQDFKNRYERLVKAGEKHKLVETLIAAGDMLIASANSWQREVQSERDAMELQGRVEAAKWRAADRSLMSRSIAAQDEHNLRATLHDRDEAATKRAGQWDTFQRLVTEASTISLSR